MSVIEYAHFDTAGPGSGGCNGLGEIVLGAVPAVVGGVVDPLPRFGGDVNRLPLSPGAGFGLLKDARTAGPRTDGPGR